MKLRTLLLLIFATASVTLSYSQDDEGDRKGLMSAVTDLSGFGLSKDKQEELEETNKNVLQGLFDIADSDKSEDEKIALFKKKKEENEKKYKDILGDKGLKSYKKQLKKKTKKYRRTFKLAKWII